MKKLHVFLILTLASLLFTACGKKEAEESQKAVETSGVTTGSMEATKEQLTDLAESAKKEVGEAVEAVKANAQEVVDHTTAEIAEAKEAAVEKIEVIVEESQVEVEGLKVEAQTKLQGMFNKKVEEATFQEPGVE